MKRVRIALGALLLVVLACLAVINVFLNSGLVPSLILGNDPDWKMGYRLAWSIWPTAKALLSRSSGR